MNEKENCMAKSIFKRLKVVPVSPREYLEGIDNIALISNGNKGYSIVEIEGNILGEIFTNSINTLEGESFFTWEYVIKSHLYSLLLLTPVSKLLKLYGQCSEENLSRDVIKLHRKDVCLLDAFTSRQIQYHRKKLGIGKDLYLKEPITRFGFTIEFKSDKYFIKKDEIEYSIPYNIGNYLLKLEDENLKKLLAIVSAYSLYKKYGLYLPIDIKTELIELLS